LTFRDVHGTHVFTGPQIKTEETKIGMLVSVVTQPGVDHGSMTFTIVIISKVNLRFEQKAQSPRSASQPAPAEGHQHFRV
jgi:hypothetical protein